MATVLALVLLPAGAALAQPESQGESQEESSAGPASPSRLVRAIEADPAGWPWAVRHRSAPLRALDQKAVAEAAAVDLDRAASSSRTGDDWRRALVWAVAAREHRLVALRPALEGALEAHPVLGERLCAEIAMSVAALAPEKSARVALLRRPEPCVLAGAVRQLAGLADPELRDELETLLARRGDFGGTVLDRTLGDLKLRNDFAAWWHAHPDPAARLDFVLERVGMIFDPAPAGLLRPRTDAPHGRFLLARAVELRLADRPLFDRRLGALAGSLKAENPPHAALLRRLADELGNPSHATTQDTP